MDYFGGVDWGQRAILCVLVQQDNSCKLGTVGKVGNEKWLGSYPFSEKCSINVLQGYINSIKFALKCVPSHALTRVFVLSPKHLIF